MHVVERMHNLGDVFSDVAQTALGQCFSGRAAIRQWGFACQSVGRLLQIRFDMICKSLRPPRESLTCLVKLFLVHSAHPFWTRRIPAAGRLANSWVTGALTRRC